MYCVKPISISVVEASDNVSRDEKNTLERYNEIYDTFTWL